MTILGRVMIGTLGLAFLAVVTTHDARARAGWDVSDDQALRSDDAHRVVDLPDADGVVGRDAATQAMMVLAEAQDRSIVAGTFCLVPKLQIADTAQVLLMHGAWIADTPASVMQTIRWVELWRNPLTRRIAVQERPWHIGTIHKGCTRTGQSPGEHGHDSDKAVAEWLECSCEHTCEPGNDETNGRKWDPKCESRCSASHCHCPNPCAPTSVR